MDLKADVIDGAKAICEYLDRSEPTLMKLIKQYDLVKAGIIFKRGGVWMANKDKLRKWWLNVLLDRPGKLPERQNPKKQKKFKGV